MVNEDREAITRLVRVEIATWLRGLAQFALEQVRASGGALFGEPTIAHLTAIGHVLVDAVLEELELGRYVEPGSSARISARIDAVWHEKLL